MSALPPRDLAALLAKSPADVVILSPLRTPVCRSYKSHLKDAYPEELLAAVRVVLSDPGGSKAARMALNHVGFPNETCLYTANRACAASLQAIATVAVGIGAGMESMTRNYGSRAVPVDVWPTFKDSPAKDARDCIMPMGLVKRYSAPGEEASRPTWAPLLCI